MQERCLCGSFPCPSMVPPRDSVGASRGITAHRRRTRAAFLRRRRGEIPPQRRMTPPTQRRLLATRFWPFNHTWNNYQKTVGFLAQGLTQSSAFFVTCDTLVTAPPRQTRPWVPITRRVHMVHVSASSAPRLAPRERTSQRKPECWCLTV